jgi:hypothetical protein
MSKISSIKFQPNKWLAILGFASIATIAIAITSTNTSFTPQNQPVGYIAQDEATNFNLTSGTEKIFRPDYSREYWNGNLYAYPVSASGTINFGSEPWVGGAAGQLALQNFDTGRYIATRNASVPSVGIPFRYSSMSASQQTMFPAMTVSTNNFTGTQVVNFLRGDRSNESPAGLRNRSADANGAGGPTLGDIIHSRPYYVTDTTNPTVFVGANDGMLHAFNATTGAERWAYVPSMLLSKMAKLASPYGTTTNPHDYFVDGRINIGNVNISGTPTRILVSTLGAGGRGLFALNIDGSSGLAAGSESDVVNKVLWEIDGTAGFLNNNAATVPTAYDNLGYTYGVPLMVKVNAGGGVNAIVLGNGYNDNPAGNYQAFLYIINAADGQLIAQIPAGATGSSSSPNGLFNPVAIDTNGDGIIDRVYAGDLKGTMWKFDLSSGTSATWSSSTLFVTNPAQPITSTPGVALHPNGGYMVNFATGSMLDTADTTDSTVHYVYGVWDGAPVANTSLMTSTLQERSYVDTYGVATRVRRSLNIATPNWNSGGNLGWKVALPAGEKVVGEGSFIESSRYYFTSYNPNISFQSGATTVTGATISSGGSGYSTASVSFSGGGGSGAAATATISGGVITDINITASGTGYTSAPTVTITGSGGSGATATAVLSAGTTVTGENWLMELNYLTGGSTNTPFLDLSADQLLNDNDRIKYISSDSGVPGTCDLTNPTIAVSSACAIQSTDGIAVGKFISNGVQSQPILVQLSSLNTTFFNENPDVVFPITEVTYGIAGGHFDVDIFYQTGVSGDNLCTTTTPASVPAAKAVATITVGTTGQTSNIPATLGAIQVNGVTIAPALTITDITNGTDKTTNTTIIKNAINAGGSGYTATSSGYVITISAPATGTSYNGYALTIQDGTSQPITAGTPGSPAVPAIYPTGLITFSGTTNSSGTASAIAADLAGPASVKVGSIVADSASIAIGKNKGASTTVSTVVSAIGSSCTAGPGCIWAYVGGNSVTPTCAAQNNKTVCLVDTSTLTNGNAVTMGTQSNYGSQAATFTATAGGSAAIAAVPGVPATGWSNFKPALSFTPVFANGTDLLTSPTITNNCNSQNGNNSNAHIHQYDKKYDRTGVDMLNPSVATHKLSNAVTSNTIKYKVLVHNQYLNPAVKFHIANSSYDPSVDLGYINVRDYEVSSTLNVDTLPVYNGTSNSTGTTGTVGSPAQTFNPIGSLVFNMPVDALTPKNWWSNGDIRAGLQPMTPGCGGQGGASAGDGNMYKPVIPPVNGVDGPGINGWNSNTVSLNATGVRHGGALTFQIIKWDTPNSAVEQNVAGRPEYGWRVKSGSNAAYVLVEYTVYWHHPNGLCYGSVGWSKAPARESTTGTPSAVLPGSTDPKIGNLSGTGGGTVTSVTRVVTGNVTVVTITYSSGATATITTTVNADGSTTVVTRDADCVTAGSGCTGVTNKIRKDDGNIITGGDERGTRARTGRVSWHELIRQ